MFHNFTFFQSDMVFEIINSFLEYLMSLLVRKVA